MNSTSFFFNPKSRSFDLIPYVNMGLVVGNTRSGGGAGLLDIFSPDRDGSIGARHRELIASCPPHLQLQVHELFLRKNRKLLTGTSLPWYVPEKYGGIGLRAIYVYVHLSDDVDDCFRQYARTSTGHLCGPSKVDLAVIQLLKGRTLKSVRPIRLPDERPVQTRAVWMKYLYEVWGGKDGLGLTESEEAFLDLSCYFLVPSEVMAESDTERRVEILRHNEWVWRAFYNHVRDEDLSEMSWFQTWEQMVTP
jgi:hypothetical protein